MMSGTTRTTSNPGAIAAPLLSRDFVLLLVMQAVFGICSSTFFLLPKVVAAYWGGDALDIALFAAAFGIGSVVAVPLIGPVVDRHGLRVPLVAACVLVMTSALGFGAVVRGLGPLALVLRGLQGLAWTTVFSCGLVATTVVTPRDRIAQGLGLYGVSNLATNAIAPAIAEPLFEQIGLASTFLLAAAFGAASIPIAAAVRTATPAGARAVSLRSPRSPGRASRSCSRSTSPTRWTRAPGAFARSSSATPWEPSASAWRAAASSIASVIAGAWCSRCSSTASRRQR